MNNYLDRTIKLIGQTAVEALNNSSILVVGVGGVGGFVCEFLARSGVAKLTIVDCDVVDVSNINRQIIATIDTIGLPKVDVVKQRLTSIRDNLVVDCKHLRFNQQNIAEVFDKKYDFVIDAIDSVADKTVLIKHCIDNNINIVSAMGSGNRYDLPHFEIVDLSKTQNDGLARAMRKALKDVGIIHAKCCISRSHPMQVKGAPASIAYYPPASACVISAYVVNCLIGEQI